MLIRNIPGPRWAPKYYAFFRPHRLRTTLLLSTLAHARSICATQNSQLVLRELRFGELDRNRCRCRLLCRSAHRAMASWEKCWGELGKRITSDII